MGDNGVELVQVVPNFHANYNYYMMIGTLNSNPLMRRNRNLLSRRAIHADMHFTLFLPLLAGVLLQTEAPIAIAIEAVSSFVLNRCQHQRDNCWKSKLENKRFLLGLPPALSVNMWFLKLCSVAVTKLS